MNLRDAFAYQAEACRQLGSPFMGRLCDLFAAQDWPDTPVVTRLNAWRGALGPRGDSVPLRVCGALHALRLQNRAGLDVVYPPNAVDDAQLWAAVAIALVTEDRFINDWINSPPQTNEVRRSAAIIPAACLLAERYGLPMRTSELGASGGLNLNWDRYALDVDGVLFGAHDPVLTLHPDWTGSVPPQTSPRVAEKAGVDLRPVDPRTPHGAERLRAYLWPDQQERITLTDAAIAATTHTVEEGDAIDWLRPRLNHQKDQLHLIYHTVAWQYFPQAKQDEGRALIEAAGATAGTNSPLAWLSMENDGAMRGAALTLRLWPDDLQITLGRADFHGRWIEWHPQEG